MGKMMKLIFLVVCLFGKISSESISKSAEEQNNFYASKLKNLMNLLETIHTVPAKRSKTTGYGRQSGFGMQQLYAPAFGSAHAVYERSRFRSGNQGSRFLGGANKASRW